MDNLRAWCEHLHKEGVSKEKTLVACIANVDTLYDIHPTGDPGRRREVEAARMVSMLQEFMASGAHYDEELQGQFPLFRGAPPPGQPYPEAWTGWQERASSRSGSDGKGSGKGDCSCVTSAVWIK